MSEEIRELDHDDPDRPTHPDVDYLEDLLWKSEIELDQLMDLNVVEH